MLFLDLYKFDDFKKLLILFCFSMILSIIILFVSYLFSKKEAYTEKLSTYECGFEPYEDARNQFDVQFYLIAIIYLIFDIEVVFLYPWAVVTTEISAIGFSTILDFLIELWIGFVFLWRTRILTWTHF